MQSVLENVKFSFLLIFFTSTYHGTFKFSI